MAVKERRIIRLIWLLDKASLLLALLFVWLPSRNWDWLGERTKNLTSVLLSGRFVLPARQVVCHQGPFSFFFFYFFIIFFVVWFGGVVWWWFWVGFEDVLWRATPQFPPIPLSHWMASQSPTWQSPLPIEGDRGVKCPSVSADISVVREDWPMWRFKRCLVKGNPPILPFHTFSLSLTHLLTLSLTHSLTHLW